MVFPRLCIFILAACCSLGAWAADDEHITRGEPPPWVIEQKVDFAASDEAVKEQGEKSYLLLRDVQRHLGEAVDYRHIAYRLLTEAGVESGSTLSFEFDPAYERLEFHQLIVYRDGAPRDRLPQQEIKVVPRETDLENQLYDGRLTASIMLDDLRVGDVVEYAYSRRGANPIYGGHLLGSVMVERTRPVHHARERLLSPTSRPQPQFRAHGTSVVARFRPAPGDLMEYRWDADDQPGRRIEDDVPSWTDTLGWVEFSDFQSWSEVAQWAVALFAPAMPSPGAPLPEELEKQAAALEQLPAGAPRITAALRYVQDNFRYVDLEIGATAHPPYPVEKICERRSGDSTDKANLLCALLRRLGFEADPALVATDDRHTVVRRLPTPYAFDHAIVRVLWEGRAYWMDPTREHQGGTLEHIYLPAYGKALLVHAATSDLADVEAGGRQESSIEILNTFRQTNYTKPALLHVRTTFRGHEADVIRETRATTAAGDIEREYLDFYTEHYPGVRVRQALRFQDDRERNEVIAEEDYEIPKAWVQHEDYPGKVLLSLYAGTLAGRLTEPEARRRTMPFRVSFPGHVIEQFDIQLPRPPGIKPSHLEIKDAAFHFVAGGGMEKGRLRLRYEYTALAAEVAPERTAEYVANIERVRDQVEYLLWRPTLATVGRQMFSGPARNRALEALKIAAIAGGIVIVVLLGIVLFLVRRRVRRQRQQLRAPEAGPALHACVVCHRTDVSHPGLEFRVGGDGRAYCIDHLRPPSPAVRNSG